MTKTCKYRDFFLMIELPLHVGLYDYQIKKVYITRI